MGTMGILLFAAALSAGAEPPSDSAARAALATALGARVPPLSLLRVEVADGPPRLGRARVSVEGVRFPSSLTGINRSPEAELVPWSEIRGVERVRTRAGAGAVLGAATGIAAALIWISVDPPRSEAGFLRWGPTAAGKSVFRILGLSLVGSGLGAGIGGQMQKREHLYP